jgi:ADP-ribosyl-[dinitrogen reductase] hydrolase
MELEDKFIGTILGTAIGDTLGHPFEGRIKEQIDRYFDDFDRFIENNRSIFRTYTDDTQLTIHTARAIIKSKGIEENTLIGEFIEWLDDPPIGPGFGCLSSIQKLSRGISWHQAASNSGGNGTAMRISPVGLFFSKDLEGLKNAASLNSIITHSHPAAEAGARIVAAAVAHLLDKDPEEGFSIEKFFDSMIDVISDKDEPIWKEFVEILNDLKPNIGMSYIDGLKRYAQIGVKPPFYIKSLENKCFIHPYTISTVICALFIFLKNLDSFQKCIYILPTSGGDTDTCGAIGGSMAGAYFGFKNIPKKLVSLVKDADSLIQLSKDLYSAFKEQYL